MSVETPPPVPPPLPMTRPPARAEAILDEQIVRTGRQVQGVDVATGLLVLTIGVIGYLFVAALVDHWVVPGGLGSGLRLLVLLVLIAGACTYGYRFVLRPFLERINPVYVAHTIEQSQPTLKNSLINFLLLRRQPAAVAPAVFDALGRRAAADAAQVAPEVAVDRAHLIRLGYVLVGLILIGAIYQVVSPKNPLVSVSRMIWPFSSVQAPTRVTFDDVQPGDADVLRGQKVVISAGVSGQSDDEPVRLVFTTADGQSVDQEVPMSV
ncbi:MAG: hypothetical protein JW818_03455, partial [Pirellulales bacterium]|nr:hypothetical protein [Pirellulales bacterium]